jgi:restriction system protein
MTHDWRQYQERAAEFFRSIGLSASTDVTMQGVRTKHAIDVAVTIDLAGFHVQWLVECKLWQTSVSKLHVLALREIVADLGADRGIILCEHGFQSGAIEAANLTNVQVTSLAALTTSSKDAIYAARLRELYDRTERSRERYWDIPKQVRVAKGLRFPPGGGGADMYSGARVVDFCSYILAQAFRAIYPIKIEQSLNPHLPSSLSSHQDVVELLEPMIVELENKLDAASSN